MWIPRPGPQSKITDAELTALAVAKASKDECADRNFLGMIAYRLLRRLSVDRK